MTEDAKMPPSEPYSEQDMKEFAEKFETFFGNLSDKERPLASAMVVLAENEIEQIPQEKVAEAQQAEENQDVEPLSEEEIEAFMDKLNAFHDSLPEGQHQILDSMTATAFVHSVPEDERGDVQGHGYWWRTKEIPWNSLFGGTFNTFSYDCFAQGGLLRFRYLSSRGNLTFGCWKY